MRGWHRVVVVASALALAMSQTGCAGCSDKGDDDDDGSSPTPVPPVLTAIAPASGPVGTAVILTGTGLGSATQVYFGTEAATFTTYANGTRVDATVPASAPGGLVDVVVISGIVGSNALPFTVTLPPVVYVNLHGNAASNGVAGFAVGTDGSLAPLPGSPWLVGVTEANFGGDADSVRVHASTRRVFASNALGLGVWDVNPSSGALTEVAGSPFLVSTTGAFYGVDVTPAGDVVFLPDYTNNVMYALAVAGDGSLTPVPGAPFPSQVTGGMDIAKIRPDGQFLYVSDESGPTKITVYAVATNGVLTEIGGSPFTATGSGWGLEMHPSGKFLFHPADSVLSELEISAPTGTLTLDDEQTGFSQINGLAFTGDGGRLFALENGSDPELHVYDVNNGNGTLSEIAGSPFTLLGVSNAGAIDVDASGTFVFVPDDGDPDFHVFVMSTADVPVEAPGSPFVLSTAASLSASGVDAAF